MANSAELGKLTPALDKEGLLHSPGRQSRGRPGCASTLSQHCPSASVVGAYASSFSLLPILSSSHRCPWALSQLWGRWVKTINRPGSTGQGSAASSAWQRGSRGQGVPGGAMCLAACCW